MAVKKFSDPKVKMMSFKKDLEILLAEYGYLMDCRLVITTHGIKPQIVVDTPENMKGRPTPEQIAKLAQTNKEVEKNVKKEKPEQKPVPESEGEQGKN